MRHAVIAALLIAPLAASAGAPAWVNELSGGSCTSDVDDWDCANFDVLDDALTSCDDRLDTIQSVNLLVGTASGTLPSAIVAGTAPSGALGGSWASITIDDLAISEAKLASEDYGDWTCGASADDCVVDANAVALGTDTTGNYAAGDGEAGAALTGDSATSFFSTGTLEDARIASTITRDSEVATQSFGTGNPPGTCVQGSWYSQTATTLRRCQCVATDTWHCATTVVFP